ncbi:hypothetical protein BDZ89DRAFT_1063630 [Hymenopellis radicata]|nr:hypothetical protein BDZ89DRAFT_1063630 [Hymenopellis radicata]
MSITLPPELVELVVEHLVGDERTLRSCALVARTWAGAAQRALFRNVVIPATSKQLDRLLSHLTCLPHLQTLFRLVTIQAVPSDSLTSQDAYVSHLTNLLSLLPKVVFIKVDFVDTWWEAPANESFLAVIRNFLHRAPLNVFDLFEGTNIKRVSLDSSKDDYEDIVDLGIPVKRLRLPSVECIRFDVGMQQERFHHWLTHHRANFTNLKQCEIVAHDAQELVRWQDVMSHHGFPPFETFKFELIYDFVDNIERDEDAYYDAEGLISLLPALPLGGLQFQHVHLGIVVGKVRYHIVTHDDIQRYNIEWWSAIFRAISASKATVHFTKLTFTIMPPMDVTDIWSAWTGLDHSLMHPTFRNVRSIHFEKVDRWQTTLLTEAADSALTNEMRLVLPKLASRGVLCFV